MAAFICGFFSITTVGLNNPKLVEFLDIKSRIWRNPIYRVHFKLYMDFLLLGGSAPLTSAWLKSQLYIIPYVLRGDTN